MNATTSSSAGQRKPRPKPARSIALWVKPDRNGPGVVRITVGTESADYFLTPLASAFGRAFEVHKVGTEDRYHVCLDGAQSSCECKGFLRWNEPCKHIDGLAALVAAGQL
jgi:hypothetical protein